VTFSGDLPVYPFARKLISIILHLLSHITVIGVENIPAGGGFLLTMNHLSQIDPPLVLITLPRRIRVFAAEKYRRNPALRWFFDSMGCIWVRQFEADHKALRDAIEFLQRGGILGMSPEGTRSRETHALQRARGGAALLASRSGGLVLPTAVWGTETFVSDVLHLRRAKVTVRYGKPFRLSVSPRAKGAELEQGTDEIMLAVAALLPPAYRGEYAATPLSSSGSVETGA
jgi:1-acyl-sn-glycerol-3-phosphate acyltransferase